MSSKQNTQLSKNMSYLLRHGAVKEGLTIRDDGYILIDDVLKHIQKSMKNNSVTIESIIDIVKNSDKKRFEISEDGDFIRAAQGHSMKNVKTEELLRKLTLNDSFQFLCYHGTTLKAIKSINETGLNKMDRNHIHFSIGLPGDDTVISGMRNSSDIIIELDLKKAMNDGIEFYISSNNVILSEGINGIIPPIYFKNLIYKN
jgi:2'-phosphotransferase